MSKRVTGSTLNNYLFVINSTLEAKSLPRVTLDTAYGKYRLATDDGRRYLSPRLPAREMECYLRGLLDGLEL